jgi:biotin carboxyl carrier protein
MKMEQSIASPRDGVIKTVKVSVGETVPSGTVLVEFED